MPLHRFLSPPVIDGDPSLQQKVTILHHVSIWTGMVALVALLFFGVSQATDSDLTTVLIATGLTVALTGLSHLLLHKGYVLWSANFLVVSMYVLLIAASYFEYGVLSYEIEYLVAPIAIANLTISRRWGAALTVAAVIAIAMLGRFTLVGSIEAPIYRDLSSRVFEASAHRIFILLAIGAYFYISKQAMERAHRQLRSNEIRIRQMLDLMADAALQIGLDGTIKAMNARATMILGYDSADLVGENIAILTGNRQPEQVIREINRMVLNVPVTARFSIRTKNGAELLVERRSVKMDLADDTIVFSIIRDITQETEIQERLERSQAALKQVSQRLQLIADNVPALMSYIDRDGTIKFLNQTFVQFGVDIERSVGKKMSHAMHDYFYMQAKPHVERVLTGESDIRFDLFVTGESDSIVTIDTSFVPHFVDNNVQGFFALGRDVTEQRQLLDEVRNSKILQEEAAERLHLIADNLPVHIAYVDQDMRLQFANKQYRSSGLLASGEDIGASVKSIVYPHIYTQLLPKLEQALQGQETHFELSWESRSADAVRTVDVTYVPHYHNDAVVGVFALSRDVTRERKQEQALRDTQRLESLGLMAGGIAHDFNNLLVAILGQSSLAKRKLGDDHPALRHVEKSVKAAERASKLTNQMLAYSGRGQFEIRPIDFNQLIRQNLHLLDAAIEQNVVLQTDFQPDLPLIEADTAQMQQVVMNLILNAAQAIGGAEGQISLTTHDYFIDEDNVDGWQFSGESLSPGPYISFEVADNGCGIEAHQLAKIFEPFFSTKELGSGLGLSAVLGIIRGHRGGIRVESEPGFGTLFQLLLPAMAATPMFQSKKLVPKQADTVYSAQNKVLVIDDEAGVAETVADILDLHGIASLIANGGKEGVALYHAHRHEIGVVLLDLMMPEMNGEEVFHRLRAVDPSVNVIITSGYSESEASKRFVGQDLAGFIQKPYQLEELFAPVAAALDLAKAISET